MLRLSLALLLVCASSHALAQNGRGTPPSPGACQETEATARDEAVQADSTAAKANAARSKYVQRASANRSVGGGGGDEVLPRSRGTRWHSFLPGMFR
ncbi:MAG: hypothetical protein EOP92_33415 [Lysobacteraceae bacterium]|nr:MAG: hypothetical protein EOP92_33415 [Xanthomonadaceae bacterium]